MANTSSNDEQIPENYADNQRDTMLRHMYTTIGTDSARLFLYFMNGDTLSADKLFHRTWNAMHTFIQEPLTDEQLMNFFYALSISDLQLNRPILVKRNTIPIYSRLLFHFSEQPMLIAKLLLSALPSEEDRYVFLLHAVCNITAANIGKIMNAQEKIIDKKLTDGVDAMFQFLVRLRLETTEFVPPHVRILSIFAAAIKESLILNQYQSKKNIRPSCPECLQFSEALQQCDKRQISEEELQTAIAHIEACQSAYNINWVNLILQSIFSGEVIDVKIPPISSAHSVPEPEFISFHEEDDENSENHAILLIPASDGTINAYTAFEMAGLAAMTHSSRLNQSSLFFSRMRMPALERIDVSITWSFRFITFPASNTTGAQKRVSFAAIARISHWSNDEDYLKNFANYVAQQFEMTLKTTLTSFHFVRMNQTDIAKVLKPFEVKDMVEIRQRPDQEGLPAPFPGIVDIDTIIQLMRRQKGICAVSFTVDPLNGKQFDYQLDNPDSAVSGSLATTQLSGGSQNEIIDPAMAGLLKAMRRESLRSNAFRLAVQLTGEESLGDALIVALQSEIGSPGSLRAEMIWKNPLSGIVNNADVIRPRTGSTDGTSEFAAAVRSFENLIFASWTGDSHRLLPYNLVDLNELSRIAALPNNTNWIDEYIPVTEYPYGYVESGIHLGANYNLEENRRVVLPLTSRERHMWVVGQTGTGKSTFLMNMIMQDIYNGCGVTVMDPHGELIREILGRIPAHRLHDVILFDPAETNYPLGVNNLESQTDDERARIVSTFIGMLRKMFDPNTLGIVGPRFEHAVRNGLLTIMSVPSGSTLVELMRVLTDDSYRKSIMKYVTDPLVVRYWSDQIDNTNDFHRSEVLDYIVSKFGPFVTDYTIRRIVGQIHNSFMFREAFDKQRIILMSLAKGRLGAFNANFLGLIILPMMLGAALSRVDLPANQRKTNYLYIDEFQNYATESLAQMLAETRKYGVSLILANQHVGQLTGEIRDAVIGNVGNIVSFRLGVSDAEAMARIFAPSPLGAEQFTNLPNFTAFGRVMVNSERSPVFTLHSDPPILKYSAIRESEVRAYSRILYGRDRDAIDKDILTRSGMNEPKAQVKRFNPFG